MRHNDPLDLSSWASRAGRAARLRNPALALISGVISGALAIAMPLIWFRGTVNQQSLDTLFTDPAGTLLSAFALGLLTGFNYERFRDVPTPGHEPR
jgi:hypothetical protein